MGRLPSSTTLTATPPSTSTLPSSSPSSSSSWLFLCLELFLPSTCSQAQEDTDTLAAAPPALDMVHLNLAMVPPVMDMVPLPGTPGHQEENTDRSMMRKLTT